MSIFNGVDRTPLPPVIVRHRSKFGAKLFFGLDGARRGLAAWFTEYDGERPLSPLKYQTPAAMPPPSPQRPIGLRRIRFADRPRAYSPTGLQLLPDVTFGGCNKRTRSN